MGKGFLAGLVLGAIAGAAVGALLASAAEPDHQEEEIVIGPDGSDRAGSLWGRIVGELRSRLAIGKEAYHEGVAETRQQLIAELETAHHHVMKTPLR